MADKTTFKVKQTGSAIRRPRAQRAILTGLGLGKMHRTVELEDTAATRGMVAKVAHMVEVVD